jgi:hypothetical protein
MNARSASVLRFPCPALALATLTLHAAAMDIPAQLPAPDGKPGDAGKPVQVYILAGQSNMVGMGDISGARPPWPSVMLSADPAPDPVPDPFAPGQFVALRDRGGKRTARIVGCRDGMLQLEIQRYHDRLTVWRAPGEVAVLDRPALPEAAASTRVPPPELEPAEAAAKATHGGKYRTLLTKVHARFDYLVYGAFSDYGYSKTPEYHGQTGLPEGYWVYVYPWWYIFKDRDRDASGAR